MRTSLVYLALLAGVMADPVSIPLYKRTENDGIFRVPGKALDSGVLAGKVKIGTPAQDFTFAFDTNTGYSWVRGSRCKTKNCRGRCSYYATKSSDAISTGKKFSVNYGDACVDTHVYMDTFEVGGIKVKEMPFGGAYRMSGFDMGFDGYLGLGRGVNLNLTGINSSSANSLSKRALTESSFLPNAFNQATGVGSSTFSLYVSQSGSSFDPNAINNQFPPTTGNNGNAATQPSNPVNPTNPTNPTNPGFGNASPVITNPILQPPNDVTSGGFGFVKRHNVEEEPAGYLILGGVDKSLIKGKMEYLRLAATRDGSSDRKWDICIRHAGFGKLRLPQKPNAIASISTSTSFITMPPDQADLFQTKFGGTYLPETKNYEFKCTDAVNLPLLKMTLEDHIVELPAKYWLDVVDLEKNKCVTKITRGSSDMDWVLGTSFLNAFYSAFNPEAESLGLAIKKGHKKDGLRVYRKSH